MTRYQLASPGGWMGQFIEAGSDDEAVAICQAPPVGEQVLDLQSSLDAGGEPVILLVVADDPPPDL